MCHERSPHEDQQPRLVINFFRPATPSLQAETRVIRQVLSVWGLISFALPVVIWLFGLGDPSGTGTSILTRLRLFGFPLHYWLLAQGATIGFLLVCVWYARLWKTKVEPCHRRATDGEVLS